MICLHFLYVILLILHFNMVLYSLSYKVEYFKCLQYSLPPIQYLLDVKEIKTLFEINDMSQIPKYEFGYISGDTYSSDTSSCHNMNETTVQLLGLTYDKPTKIRLYKNIDLFHPKTRIEFNDKKNSIQDLYVNHVDNDCHYIGYWKNCPSCLISLSFYDDDIIGLLLLQKESRMLKSISTIKKNSKFMDINQYCFKKYSQKHSNRDKIVIIFRTLGIPPSGETTPNITNHNYVRQKRSSGKKDAAIYRIEIAIFMDVYSFKSMYINGNKDMAIKYILTTMNMVNLLFRHESLNDPIGIYIIKIVLMTEQPDIMRTKGAWQDYLSKFCKYQASKYPLESHKWAVALLYTGIDVWDQQSTNVVGGAQTNTICHHSLACAIVEGGYHRGYNIYSAIAHELGHNIGVNHDENYNRAECIAKDYIMKAVSGQTTNYWSPCSAELISKQLPTFPCISVGGFEMSKNYYDVYHLTSGGYTTTLDEQCKAAKGVTAYHSKPKTVEKMADVCRTMSCARLDYNYGLIYFVSSGMPMDMSYCGRGMWCRDTKCVPINHDDTPAIMNRGGGNPVDGAWGSWFPYESCGATDCIQDVVPLEYWVRTCSNPYPAFGGETCTDGWSRDVPVLLATTRCPRAKKCTKTLTLAQYYPDYCKLQSKSHPDLTGDRKINRSTCAYKCTKKTGGLSWIGLSLPNGFPCDPGAKKFCLWGRCREIPMSLPRNITPRVGKMSDLVERGVTQTNIKFIVSPPTPPFDENDKFLGTKLTTTVSMSKSDRTYGYDDYHDYYYDEDQWSPKPPKDGMTAIGGMDMTPPTDEERSDRKGKKRKKWYEVKISLMKRKFDDRRKNLYLLIATILASTVCAIGLGHLLYKRRALANAEYYDNTASEQSPYEY